MLTRTQIISEVAFRLPDLNKRQVRDVLEVMAELWYDELLRIDGMIDIMGLGRLYVEVHSLRSGGAVQKKMQRLLGDAAPPVVLRHNVRFRTSERFRAALAAAYRKEASHDQG